MKTNPNKNHSLWKVIPMCLLLFLLSSCEVITGIFKAGMGFGIFIVIAVVVVIVAVIVKLGKK